MRDRVQAILSALLLVAIGAWVAVGASADGDTRVFAGESDDILVSRSSGSHVHTAASVRAAIRTAEAEVHFTIYAPRTLPWPGLRLGIVGYNLGPPGNDGAMPTVLLTYSTGDSVDDPGADTINVLQMPTASTPIDFEPLDSRIPGVRLWRDTYQANTTFGSSAPWVHVRYQAVYLAVSEDLDVSLTILLSREGTPFTDEDARLLLQSMFGR